MLAATTGCLRRRLNIVSNPPGAVVYVDNQRIGETPCALNYIYYGTREIRLVKDGFETLTLNQPIEAPWYQVPPIDFFAETLVLFDIRDERSVTFQLSPQVTVRTEELLGRADNTRRAVQTGAPLPGTRQNVAPPLPLGAQELPVGGQVLTPFGQSGGR